MIYAVHDALQRQQYLRAAQEWDFFRAVLGMRLELYGEQPAAGWRFYTGARGVCAALTVRGDTAFACGAWDKEELGAFLSFLGVQNLVVPEASIQYRQIFPGYISAQVLSLYTLMPGAQLALPAAQAEYALARDPPMQAVTKLLWGSGEEADAFYAEACAARNRGWAEYRLASIGGEAVSTVGAAAICGGEAYMAAGQTAAAWRRKGIAGRMIVQLANELSARGLRVSLLCEPELCAFYERLGFASGGQYTRAALSLSGKSEKTP
jgi:GNAT superfamily N-acetyltransferase